MKKAQARRRLGFPDCEIRVAVDYSAKAARRM